MKPHMRAIVGFLRELGATDVDIQSGGKHPRIVYHWRGAQHCHVVSSSPTNIDHAAAETIREIKHDLGLVDHEKRVGARRRRARRIKIVEAPSAPVLAAAPLPDWHAALEAHPAALATASVRLRSAWRHWFRDILVRNGTPLLRPL